MKYAAVDAFATAALWCEWLSETSGVGAGKVGSDAAADLDPPAAPPAGPAPRAGGEECTPSPALDIRGDMVEDTLHAVKAAGHSLPLDATEPRLLPTGTGNESADEMAVRLSHVPPWVPYGV